MPRELPQTGFGASIDYTQPSFDLSDQIRYNTQQNVQFLKDKRNEQLLFEGKVREELSQINPMEFWQDIDDTFKNKQNEMIQGAIEGATDMLVQQGGLGNASNLASIRAEANRIKAWQNGMNSVMQEAQNTIQVAAKNDDLYDIDLTKKNVMEQMAQMADSVSKDEAYTPQFQPQIRTVGDPFIYGVLSDTANKLASTDREVSVQKKEGDKLVTQSKKVAVRQPLVNENGTVKEEAVDQLLADTFGEYKQIQKTYLDMAKSSFQDGELAPEAQDMYKKMYGSDFIGQEGDLGKLALAMFVKDDEFRSHVVYGDKSIRTSTKPYEEKKSGGGTTPEELYNKEVTEVTPAYTSEGKTKVLTPSKTPNVQFNVNDAKGLGEIQTLSSETVNVNGKFLGWEPKGNEVYARVKYDPPESAAKDAPFITIKLDTELEGKEGSKVDVNKLPEKIRASLATGFGRASLNDIKLGADGKSITVAINRGTVLLVDYKSVAGGDEYISDESYNYAKGKLLKNNKPTEEGTTEDTKTDSPTWNITL